MDPGSMNCFAIKHQKIHTKCVVVYFCKMWKSISIDLKQTFAFLTLISIEMTLALQETGMSKKTKKRKMTVLINVKSTFKLEWTWISYKQGRLILEVDEKKNHIDFFWLLLCVNVYLLLRCHNCDQTCLVGLKSQKKSGMGPIWYTRPTGEHTGLLCRPMVYGIRPASQYRPSQNTHHPAALPGQAIVRSTKAATAMAKLSSLCRASSSLFTQQAWNKMKIHCFTAAVKRFCFC
jgi:hypothetical protein